MEYTQNYFTNKKILSVRLELYFSFKNWKTTWCYDRGQEGSYNRLSMAFTNSVFQIQNSDTLLNKRKGKEMLWAALKTEITYSPHSS